MNHGDQYDAGMCQGVHYSGNKIPILHASAYKRLTNCLEERQKTKMYILG